MTSENRLDRYSRNLLITSCLIISVAISFALYVRAGEGIIHANEQRYLSAQLADELHQSSDDLTRMIRTYVVTGDPVFKKHYQDILDIRNGKKPRPENYQHIYWDLVTANAKLPHPGSRPAIALLELMRQAGFTEQEFRKLQEAKANSDALTTAEFEAMKLVESSGPAAEANRLRARLMMHDTKYHQAKAAIMKPIDEFFDLLDKRTLDAVRAEENSAAILRYLFIALGLGMMVMLWRTHAALRDLMGGSVDEVYAQISRIGSGDFSSAIKLEDGLKNSVRGWLSETQTKLNDLEHERKRIEGEYRTLIQTSFDGFCIADLSGRILEVNEAYCQMLGYTREEFLRLQVRDFEASESPEETAAHFQKFISTGSDRFQTQQRRKDGAVIDVEASVQYVAELGERIFSFIRDITERKRTEEALRQIESMLTARLIGEIIQRKRAEQESRQLNAELEQRVLLRTAQLQAANADLEGFSYSVSHDLRAPLRAIDGFASMLREDYAPQLDAEGQRLFQVVSDNAKKMGQLIDDILAFSRAGRSEMQLTTLDMKALVQKVWQELEPQRAGRAIELRLGELPAASGDPAALHQVLQNLLENAVKFTRGHEPAVIEVGGQREGAEILYSVRDNGAGFDMEYLSKLFGLFQRLHGMEEFEGTGVGLAIVKRFIMKHGGRVWAEGKPGEGASFWFTLPLAAAGNGDAPSKKRG